MFHTLPFTIRDIRATEARLELIYEAARNGLKGDSLALAAGMLPVEFRRLCQLDEFAQIAALKGKADSEMESASALRTAALSGDAKAALAILQHVHGWTARQEIGVDVTNRISVSAALEEARQRVVEGAAVQIVECDTPITLSASPTQRELTHGTTADLFSE